MKTWVLRMADINDPYGRKTMKDKVGEGKSYRVGNLEGDKFIETGSTQ